MSVNKAESMSFSVVLRISLMAALLGASTPALAQEPQAPESGDKPSGKLMLEEEEMSSGMHLPFDGSSKKAFEKSMESIQAETTEAEFTTVQNAIDYLLVYDLAARGNPEVLYERLDGKTPVEMLRMVNWQTGKRGARTH